MKSKFYINFIEMEYHKVTNITIKYIPATIVQYKWIDFEYLKFIITLLF